MPVPNRHPPPAAYHRQFLTPPSSNPTAYSYPHIDHSSITSALLPSLFASVPFYIRARQCLTNFFVYRLEVPSSSSSLSFFGDKRCKLQLVNACKYLASLLPILLSFLQKLDKVRAKSRPPLPSSLDHYLESELLFSLLLSSSFSFAWDLIMDWGFLADRPLFSVPLRGSPLESNISLPLTLVMVLLNFALRCSWMLRYYQHIFNDWDHYVLVLQFLEVLRRGLWNILRVEWELMGKRGAATGGGGGPSAIHHNYAAEKSV